ncbi:MAG: hypothetical protein QHH10_08270 [Peptococcaceae bacterium]|jgi:hypothetical protein|nr:hypothetical protein [Peptococcaceae bacterium]MDH7525289.1 hypothetical protein [Peptococcaceae bacterium]
MAKKVLELKKPIMINGEEVSAIAYDFDAMTLQDMVNAEKYMTEQGCVTITTEELNMTWHSYFFAYSAAKANKGTDVSDYLRLTGRDALKARELAKNFLLGLDAEDSPAGEASNSEKQL